MKKVGTVVERDMRERPRAFQADGARADPSHGKGDELVLFSPIHPRHTIPPKKFQIFTKSPKNQQPWALSGFQYM